MIKIFLSNVIIKNTSSLFNSIIRHPSLTKFKNIAERDVRFGSKEGLIGPQW